ncbi:hypothetical protein RJ640_022800 [Escallonia rubra]|uniref:Uncharacterized protein n=1 Tax=Escallonia rubra TaxID=112253 RepID=A0AA88RN48_9ASTE|nr:hypothetical protein RJ640_022800 [Escallonia rubra]
MPQPIHTLAQRNRRGRGGKERGISTARQPGEEEQKISRQITTNPDLISVPYLSDFHAKIAALVAHDGLHFWQFLIVGMVDHMVMFSIDLIKTRMQALSWIGITCSNGRRVTAVNLPDMSLTGTIPKEVGNLTSLVFLNISNNSLQGHLPAEVGLLHQLQYMNLLYNELSGEIPSSLSRCWKLRQLLLNANKFNGSIPGSIGNLSKLEELDLGENDLQGRIPQEMSNLISLTILSFLYNKLEGPIPAGILNISSLQTVTLAKNSLYGSLPPDMLPGTGIAIENGLDGGWAKSACCATERN